ncbi:hypothetical protein M2350_003349 [Candidatus Fervidibacter sacchari]|uniref:Uncharacterized protein n=1 Tax=Candidatus Fervidibacter sacchari TaxID=1448929 RepID=A0ABT2EVF6_9BACT|nr:hypothetical protein [Candidatus Fervidibacter sacchari]
MKPVAIRHLLPFRHSLLAAVLPLAAVPLLATYYLCNCFLLLRIQPSQQPTGLIG